MEADLGEMNPDLGQDLVPSSHRGRRIGASLLGSVGTFAVIIGVLVFFVLSYIGSSSSASSTVRSALDSESLRRAIAEELVTQLEEGGDNGEPIVIRVDHRKVVDAVEKSLGDSNLRDAAGNAAASFYGVYLEGLPPTTVNIQIFADKAFGVIQLIDPSIPDGVSPQLDPIDVSRSNGTPDLASIRSRIRLVPWTLTFGGLLLIALSWWMSVAGTWLRVRRIGIRFFLAGLTLTVLTYIARSISLGDESSSRIAEALVLFVTNRLIVWTIVVTVIGAIVTLLGAIMNRRVTSTHIASA